MAHWIGLHFINALHDDVDWQTFFKGQIPSVLSPFSRVLRRSSPVSALPAIVFVSGISNSRMPRLMTMMTLIMVITMIAMTKIDNNYRGSNNNMALA